jgi:hypothetical protein
MLRFNLNDGKEYNIRFQYNRPYKVTEAILEEKVGDREHKLVAKGIAICSSKDLYTKAEGRKHALAKLFKFMKWDKETRTTLWKLYHSVVSKKYHHNVDDC